MTTRPLRVRGGAATALLLLATLATLAGCGDPAADAGEPVTAPAQVDVRATQDGAASLTARGAWWAEGVLHVGDQTVEVGRLRSFSVADRTVPFVSRGGRLCFTDLTDSACSGFRPDGDLVVSPDGGHLGFLDQAFGEQDAYDTPLLTATVIELSTGRVVASSTQGMGDVDEDDLADLYEDAYPHFDGFDDTGAALISSASGDPYALPVDGSDPRTIPYDPAADALPGRTTRDVPGETVTIRRGGGQVQIRDGRTDSSTNQGRLSPDGEVVVAPSANDQSDLVVFPAPAGSPVPLTGQQGSWYFFGTWAGPHEFLATTLEDDQTAYRLYRCDAVAATCTLEQDLPVGKAGTDAVIFPTATGSDVEAIADY